MEINKVGAPKIDYKNHETVNFQNLDDYLLMAKKTISRFSNRSYDDVSFRMLKDEDAIASVAYAIMMADWRYDENYSQDQEKQKTRYSYRNQCAIWAIKSYITRSNKQTKRKPKITSLNYHYENSKDCYSYIKDHKTSSPEELAIRSEEDTIVNNEIDYLLNNSNLSTKQKEHIRLYYLDKYTLQQIADKYSLTKEAIRQSIMKGMDSIRSTHA